MKVRSYVESGVSARITVRYEVDDELYEFSHGISKDDLTCYNIGDTINVFYEGGNPQNAMDDMHNRGGGVYILLAVILSIFFYVLISIYS